MIGWTQVATLTEQVAKLISEMRPMKEEDKPLPSRIQARQFIFLPVFLLFKNI